MTIKWTKYVQKEILAIQVKTFALRIRLKKEWAIPRQEGKTVMIIPSIKIGFESTM